MDVIRFTVNERPQSQGSIVNRHHANPKLKKFRQSVGYEALFAMAGAGEHKPLLGPIQITLDLYFEKPESAKRAFPTVPPDVDRCARAILDSLTGVVYKDDAQVIELHASKWYGTPERVEVVIRQAAVTSPAGEF